MRATRITAVLALGAALTAPAWGALRVLKSDGREAGPDEATRTFNENTGGWDITLLALYAPGDWTSYDIVGDAGEVIDRLVIDVPCWRDPQGDCIPAGSPVVVRVVSDGGEGVRTVHEILQTGTAETILNLVDVREDLGTVQVEAIGLLKAGRDVIGPVHATTPDNPGRGINFVEAQRDVLGDLSAEQGIIATIVAYGRVGTDLSPVSIRAKHGVHQVAGYGGVWGDIETRINGGAGTMFALGGSSFHGTLDTEAMFSPYEGWPARISVWGRFEGLINIGRSFEDSDEWMEFARDGLGGQIIINGDGLPTGGWASPIYIGFEGDPERFAIPGPRYDTAPESIGGGSIGLAPFALHAEACDPPDGAVVAPGDPLVVRLHHYGPVVLGGSAPLLIERRPVGGGSFVPVPLDEFDVAVDPGATHTVIVGPADGGQGFVAGHEYRVQTTADLVCAVVGSPPVAWADAYHVSLDASGCPADQDGDGNVNTADLVAILSAWGPCGSCPADLDEDGVVGFSDLLTLLGAWGPCPASGPGAFGALRRGSDGATRAGGRRQS